MNFERPNLGNRVKDGAEWLVQNGCLQRVNGIANEVAVGVAIKPSISGQNVVVIDKGAFDFQVNVGVFGQILAGR